MIQGEGSGQTRRVPLRDEEWDAPRSPSTAGMAARGLLIVVLLAILALTALAAGHHARHGGPSSALSWTASLPSPALAAPSGGRSGP